jgi:hypothetical protein
MDLTEFRSELAMEGGLHSRKDQGKLAMMGRVGRRSFLVPTPECLKRC